MAFDYVVFSSYGNDSIALLQLLREHRLPEQRTVAVVYSDTKWANGDWDERVVQASRWAESLGYFTARTEPELGFADLVRKRKIFPRGRAQFCTSELKIVPAQRWLEAHDPERRAVCIVGVRRAESQRRAGTPPFVPISDAHGGRQLWHPLVEFSDESRDALVRRAGWDVLPHRSEECACIFSNRSDLRRFSEDKIAEIRGLEQELAADGSRTMFRPKAYAGAKGIDEVIRWARSERGQYRADQDDEPDCDSGMCGV